jgi:hypothetical protein
MSDVDLGSISKDEFIKRSDEQFNSFQHYISDLSEEQLTKLKDAAGWSVKDHLYHLALSEGIIVAILEGQSIHEYMGIDLETYKQGDDAVNAVVQKQTRDLPLAEVLETMRQKHQQAMERVRATPEADLQRAFNDYRPNDTPRDGTVMLALANNAFHHYEEHTPWIVDILNLGAAKMSKDELLQRIEQGFQAINSYLDSLSESQVTEPSDATGWTAKDHIIHMATWEDSILALLSGTAQWEHMNVPREIWKQGEDPINAVIQQRYKDMPLDEVRRKFHENHQRVLDKLKSMSDEDLHKPYNYYQAISKQGRPMILWIQGNTYQHYEAHQPWIAAIVNR